jgi:putative transposase
VVGPQARKRAVTHLREKRICSQRRACGLMGVWRSGMRYERRARPDEAELRERMGEIARKHRRHGYRLVWARLRRSGWRVNKKRVHRLRKAEGLSLPHRRRKRRRWGPKGEVVRRAEYPRHVWSYDIIEDRTERGGKLRILCVMDEYTRECLAVRVERSISGAVVAETLEWLFLVHGAPAYIRSDNGGEFIAGVVQRWLAAAGCATLYIRPGSPWENPYIESFHGRLRDECLNQEVFYNGREAQIIIEAWREEYNRDRPHSSLGYATPAEFAARCRAETDAARESTNQALILAT